jgi:hypothetical protein
MFELVNQYDQPGGVDGPGFLDLASDGENYIYGVDGEQIVEFTAGGEYGDQYSCPEGMAEVSGIAADFRDPIAFYDFYLGGDEGFIIRTDDSFREQERIQVGDTIRSLAMKGNARALYVVTKPRFGIPVLAQANLTTGKVVPLFPLQPPNPGAELGGIEITHNYHDGKGSLVGVWCSPGDDSDWLFVMELYAEFLAIYPDWKLLMPGAEAEWEIEFAGDMVEEGVHHAEFYLSVNGNGEGGAVQARLNAHPAGVDDENPVNLPAKFQIQSVYPNPFNSQTNISFILPEKGNVEFAVFDALGRRVSFEIKEMSAGMHTVIWSARDMSAGTYLLKVTALGVEHSQKLVLVK